MAEWGYEDDWGASYDPSYYYGEDMGAYSSPDYMQSPAYQSFTGWGDPTGIGSSGDATYGGEAGSGGGFFGGLGSVLGSIGGFLGQNAGVIGPLAGAAGSIAGGAIGSNAANDAARLQAATANRGLDIQQAMWLQNLERQAPWLQAGREALPQLQQLAGQGAPASFTAPNTPIWGQHAGYAPPSATPGWTPQNYQGPAAVQAGDYRWTPGQGPSAQDFRYTPGQTPDASAYQSVPPQLYQGVMPGTQVPTLSGQELLAQDPGAAFRQSAARKALEGSAAARGGLLSGGTLQALQSRSQDLAAQEYQSAWERMMRRNTEQYGRDWGQYQQNWNQGVQGTQLGLQTNAQNFGQAMSAAQLREQISQVASQQGWSQSQAEAAFREAMSSQASQQGFGQALAGQQNQFAQGLQAQQWNQQQAQQYQQEMYARMLQQAQERYGRDVSENQLTYDRALQGYNSQQQAQNTQWNRLAGLAGVGQTSVGQLATGGQNNATQMSSLLGQLGNAQAGGALGGAQGWISALGNVGNSIQGGLQNASLLSTLQNLNR